ncbi:histone-lysine N-methyltransferase SETMAR [Trichonephila clavipes]|nr:histone-lysine N-methyltransferase SETMAR [Trichonephila clavipes]
MCIACVTLLYAWRRSKHSSSRKSSREVGGRRSPDLTPSDFHPFLHLKSFLAGKHFNNDKELKENVSNWLKTQAATFYEEGIEKLVPRYDTCLQNFGSYVER